MNIFKNLQEKRIQKKLDEFNKSGMLRYFHYDFGRMRGDRISYTIMSEGEALILTVQDVHYEKGESDNREYELPPIVMQQLKSLIRDYRIFLWKGYDKHNSMIEGDSFSFRAKFDKYDIMAEGASMMPAGFDDANKAIIDFFKALTDGV